MFTSRWSCLAIAALILTGCATNDSSGVAKSAGRTAPAVQPTTEPTTDPRSGVLAFFKAVRGGDEAAAFACWENDMDNRDEEQEHRKYVQNIVRNYSKSLCANYRFDQA